MTVIPFDTLKFATTLENSGFTPQQAKGAATALGDAFAGEILTKGYFDNRIAATKSDLELKLAQVKGDLEAKLAQVNGDLEAKLAQVNGDLEAKLAKMKGDLEAKLAQVKGDLEAKIEATKSELLKYMIGQTFVLISVIMALNHFGH